MSKITIDIPNRMHIFMKKHTKVDWNYFIIKSIDHKLRNLQLEEDLRACREGEKEIKAGNCIPFDEVIKQLGIEKEMKLHPKQKNTKKKILHARKK